MRAAFYQGAGSFTTGSADVPRPGPGQALLRVRRVGICGTDLHIFQGHLDHRIPLGGTIGHETLADVVEAPTGSGFRAGERVVVEPLRICGACRACRMGAAYLCYRLQVLGVDLGREHELTSGFPAVFDPTGLEAGMLLERALLDVGGYIGDFSLYAVRYLRAARVVVYEPAAVAHHRPGADDTGLFRHYHDHRNRLRTLLKNYGAPTLAKVSLPLIGFELWSLAALALRGRGAVPARSAAREPV